MITLTNEQIWDVAQDLDIGLRCFVELNTNELISIPDLLKNPDIDSEAWDEDIEKLESNPDSYQEIEAMRAKDSFQIMEDFTESLPETKLKSKLIDALNRNKPFRNFNAIIHDCDYREDWFAFKNERLKEWVKDQVNELNESIELDEDEE